jgi:hypothetical protein
MPIRLFVLALFLAPLPAIAPAQTRTSPDQRDVLAVIDRFMQAITAGDSAGLAGLQLEGGVVTVVRTQPDGAIRVTRRPTGGSSLRSGMRERYWDPQVLVHGSIAMVWAPYEFWVDEKTTHCGVDVFDLVKQNGVWKVAGAMYTVEPDGCPALRPSDPTRIRPSGDLR